MALGRRQKTWKTSVTDGTYVHKRKTEIDPVGDDGTNSNCRSFHTNQETTVVCFGTFGNPRRNSSSIRTVSHASDHTTDDELNKTANIASRVSRTKGAHRDDGSNDHDNGAHKHDPSTAHTFAKEVGEKGT